MATPEKAYTTVVSEIKVWTIPSEKALQSMSQWIKCSNGSWNKCSFYLCMSRFVFLPVIKRAAVCSRLKDRHLSTKDGLRRIWVSLNILSGSWVDLSRIESFLWRNRRAILFERLEKDSRVSELNAGSRDHAALVLLKLLLLISIRSSDWPGLTCFTCLPRVFFDMGFIYRVHFRLKANSKCFMRK